MRDELLNPLQRILVAAQTLLAETDLTFFQEKQIQAIFAVSRELIELIITVPDLTWEKAREILSYEGRSHLASIIGYAEELLDEADDPLDDYQRDNIDMIRSDGRLVLGFITHLEN